MAASVKQVGFPGTAASVRRVGDPLRRPVLEDGADPPGVLDRLCRCLSGDFDTEHSTFQLESADRRSLEEAYHA